MTKNEQRGCCGCIVILIVLIMLGAIGGIFFPKQFLKDENSSVNNSSEDESTEIQRKSLFGWRYQKDTDKLRSTATTVAFIKSEDAVLFKEDRIRHDSIGWYRGHKITSHSYEGGNHYGRVTMSVIRNHTGEALSFTIDNDRFVCEQRGCRGAISIDGKQYDLSLEQPSDDSKDTLFAARPHTLIKALQEAGKIVVELPFYHQGDRQFTFAPAERLHWPPAPSDFPSTEKEEQEP